MERCFLPIPGFVVPTLSYSRSRLLRCTFDSVFTCLLRVYTILRLFILQISSIFIPIFLFYLHGPVLFPVLLCHISSTILFVSYHSSAVVHVSFSPLRSFCSSCAFVLISISFPHCFRSIHSFCSARSTVPVRSTTLSFPLLMPFTFSVYYTFTFLHLILESTAFYSFFHSVPVTFDFTISTIVDF